MRAGKSTRANTAMLTGFLPSMNGLRAKLWCRERTWSVYLWSISRDENLAVIKKEQYTRFPVAKGSKDNIIGILNTKQFFLRYDTDRNVGHNDAPSERHVGA